MSGLPEVEGFVIERSLGRGAAAEVFRARERSGLQRLVALKLFYPHQEGWFEAELEVLRQVEELRRRARAPQLLQSLGSGRWRGGGWIAFELQEGGSLADLVQRSGPLPLAEALPLLLAAAEGVELLHAAGLFHRDLKPSNILMAADGSVRLADFGLTRALDQTATAAGSPAFCAPEVIAGRRDADGRRVDVYGLAATLYFLLLGETMLPGRPDVFALERAGLPRPLQRVLCAASAAEPSERPADVALFRTQLQTAAREKKSRTLSDPRAAGVDAHNKEVSPVHTQSPERTSRGLGLILIIGLLLGLALLFGLGLFGVGFYWLTARQTAMSSMEHKALLRQQAEMLDPFWNVPPEWAGIANLWEGCAAYTQRRDAAEKMLQQWVTEDPEIVNIMVLTTDRRHFLLSARPGMNFALKNQVEVDSSPDGRRFEAQLVMDGREIRVSGSELRIPGDGAPGSPEAVLFQVLRRDD